ncbi:MAG: chloramphenicol acetyltransferase [Streptococcaceae bacterium]|nr:chloramphenicol acetyltransferase [Streptococcaceae bacterium]
MTTNIDITDLQSRLKEKELRTFPTQCWLFSRAVNDIREFRMAHNERGELGVWDYVNPRYNVFNEKTETFGVIWTEYTSNFRTFYEKCTADMNEYKSKVGFELMSDIPNIFDFSCLSWVSFTGFNLNIYCQHPFTWLAPQITIGKIAADYNGRLQLLVAIQVHHTICDGYHVGKFVERLQELCNKFEDWL